MSTIPITILARALRPTIPPEVLQSAQQIDYRATILIYLVLEQGRFAEYDAHYFPGEDIAISRLSERKNYSDGNGPAGRTVLCAELPCDPDAPEWIRSDGELGQLVHDALVRAGLPIRAAVQQVATRRLPQAYPIYRLGCETHSEHLRRRLDSIGGLLSFGRQGHFADDNTQHALHMGCCAAPCMDENSRRDREWWQAFRRRAFEAHVVEDRQGAAQWLHYRTLKLIDNCIRR